MSRGHCKEGPWGAIFILKRFTLKKEPLAGLYKAGLRLARMVCLCHEDKVSPQPDTRTVPILPYVFSSLLSFWEERNGKQ